MLKARYLSYGAIERWWKFCGVGDSERKLEHPLEELLRYQHLITFSVSLLPGKQNNEQCSFTPCLHYVIRTMPDSGTKQYPKQSWTEPSETIR